MVAISSPAPHSRSSQVAENQLKAKETWEHAFDKIVYFSPQPEPALSSEKTEWIVSDDYPQIRLMLLACANQHDWTCLINADIRVHFRLRLVERELKRRNAQAAISQRFQLPENKIVDMGLDWFAGTPWLWRQIAPKTPPYFRIGHILYDTWLYSSMLIAVPKDIYDCTGSAFIYHPKHEDRVQPHSRTIHKPNDGVMDRITWAKQRIDLLSLAREAKR